MTDGEYKRTMTILGENTEKGKAKFQQDLEDTHLLFKQFVTQNRPHLDIDDKLQQVNIGSANKH